MARNLHTFRLARAAAFAAVVAQASVLACSRRPASGTACSRPDELVCTTRDRALICTANVYGETACGGPLGCRVETGVCDTSVGSLGDPCPKGVSSFACATDRTSALVCEDGHFKTWRPCSGPLHCSASEEAGVECDTSLGNAGDPCGKTDAESCSLDGRMLLRCDGHTLKSASSCRGADGCRAQRETDTVRCDDRIAVEGDPCQTPRRSACSADGRTELVCVNGAFETKRACRHTACAIEGDRLSCE